MNRALPLFTGIALVLAINSAYAEDKKPTAEPALQEVVVTAERRTENLQAVPVTVTAVTTERLEASHVTNIQQLSALVPSLSVVDPTGYTMAFIRGIGSSTLGGGTFSSVATYIDGIYIARTTSTMFEFDGSDSVQVLAGPQGSLYGRNATAGAIVVNSTKPKPSDASAGSISATAGSFGIRDFKGSISGGLSDTLAASFSAANHQHDGFVRNLDPAGSINTQDLDNRDSFNVAGTLAFTPNDRMNFSLRGIYAQSNDHASGGYEAVGQNVLGPFGGFGHGLSDNRSVFYAVASGAFAAFGAATADRIATEMANNVVFSNRIGYTYDNQSSGYHNGAIKGTIPPGSGLFITNTLFVLNANFDFDNFSLKSATGYTDSQYHGSVQVGLEKPGTAFSPTLAAVLTSIGQNPAGATLDAAGGLGFSSTNPSNVFSQGIQVLSKDNATIKWIGGADYSRENGRVVQTGDAFGGSNVGTDDKFTVTSSAIFAQATFPLATQWSGTLGGRYTDETYDLVDFRPVAVRNPPDSLKGKKFTYTARIEHQADDWLGYAGVTSGFKTGTLNAASAGAGRALPEEVTTAEIGIKKDFVPRFRTNAAIYYSTYKNVQLNIIDQRTGGNILDNGPKASVKGLDLQAIAKVTNNFELSLGATLLDAKFTENNANLPNIKGNTLPGSSKLAVSLIGDLNMPLASGGTIAFTPTVVYNSGKFYDHLNLVGSGGATDKAYTVVNLNLEYRSPSDHWSASLWGNNVFDEKYYRTGIVAFGTFGREAIAGNPANFGVTVKVKL